MGDKLYTIVFLYGSYLKYGFAFKQHQNFEYCQHIYNKA